MKDERPFIKFLRERLKDDDDLILVILLIVMLGGVALGIVARILMVSIPWTEELVRFLFAALVFLGISAGIKSDIHISFNLLIDRFSLRAQAYLRILKLLCFAVILTIFGFYGLRMCIYYLSKDLKTPALVVNFFWVRIPIVIGSALSMIRLIQALKVALRQLEGKS